MSARQELVLPGEEAAADGAPAFTVKYADAKDSSGASVSAPSAKPAASKALASAGLSSKPSTPTSKIRRHPPCYRPDAKPVNGYLHGKYSLAQTVGSVAEVG